MAVRERKKTVAFFEIKDSDGNPFPDPLPWDKHLADIARESASARKHSLGGVDHWGQIYTIHETDHFILARYREDVSSFDIAAGNFIDTASDLAKPYVELAIVHFIPGTNRIGYVRGSHASPRVSSLEGWINMHGLVEDGVTIEPVLSRHVLSKIAGASEASLVRVGYRSDQLHLNHDDRSTIADIKRQIDGGVKNTYVELLFRVEGGTAPSVREERLKLLDVAREVSSQDFAKASAKLINYDEDGKPRAEDVNFVKHRITTKKKVKITDDEGNPVKVASAVEAIYQAIEDLSDEIFDDGQWA
jgi:hypothetical protein